MAPLSDELARLDAVGLAEAIRRKDISASEAVEATIGRIEAHDDSINALTFRGFERGRADARDPNLPEGPFRGVPMLIKDLWPATAGDPLTLGNKALKEAGYRHPTDANIVRRYREAGFVILGRTNTPELGNVATTEPVAFGPTHNPWNLDRGPGGSSGGAAAAVAAGYLPAANASDGGGSIRIPAALCGLVGLKPSRGRISLGPMQDEWGLSVQHVVCHSVRDSAAILDVTAIPFLGDGVVAPPPPRPYAQLIGEPPPRLRIGVKLDHVAVPVAPECRVAAERTARALEDLGHHVEMAHPAILDDTSFGRLFGAIWSVNCRMNVLRMGTLIGRELGPDDMEPDTWMMAENAAKLSAVDLAGAQGAQHVHRRAMADWWESGFDLLLTPTTARVAPLLGELTSTKEDPMRAGAGSMAYAAFTSAFNATGQPAISLPVHISDDGLPAGAQLVAAYGREDLLLQVGAELEAVFSWTQHRSPLHP